MKSILISRIIILTLFFISLFFIIGLSDEIKFVELTIDNFQEEVLESNIPVVIDFWASWCKPCEKMSSIIERLAEFHKDKVKFVKVDVDKNRKLLEKFRPLRGLPLLVFYKNGKEVDRIVGLVPFTIINNKIVFLLKEEKKEKKKDSCDDGTCDPPPGY